MLHIFVRERLETWWIVLNLNGFSGWWFHTSISFFISYMGCHSSHWLIFFKMVKTINHIFPWLTVSHRMFLSWLNPAFWGVSQRSATREIVSSKNLIRNNKNILTHQSIQMKIVGFLFGVNSSWFLDAWSHESQCNPKTAIQSLTNSSSRSFEDISWIMVVFRNVTSCCPPTWMITFIGNPQHKRS